jgi:hypothetical protein
MAKSFLRDLLAKPFRVHRSPVRVPGIVAWTPIASAGFIDGLVLAGSIGYGCGAGHRRKKASQLVREWHMFRGRQAGQSWRQSGQIMSLDVWFESRWENRP